jgi:hypothetical protein
MAGPYATEREALDDCAAVYDAMRVSTGLMQALNVAVLQAACRDAGVGLGRYDRQVLGWLARFEPQQTQAIADIIRRASEGRRS